MCGILFSSKEIIELEKTIKYLKKRGPDHTEHKIIQNYHFVHVLLSMTGENFTIQPFVYKDIIIMFNGEIYNYKDFGDFNSDGECIIESYKKYGDDFVKYLDGEFALLLVDFSKDLLYYSTDIFSIKPLWFAQDENDIGICSYSSSLEYLGFKNIKQIDANTTIKMKLSTREVLTKKTVYDFDLNQHKKNFNDWNKAFEKAIKKRTSGIKHGIFIGLSGGYDSGLISCVLNRLNIDYTAYTILGSEDLKLINKRHNLLKNGKIIDMSQDDFLKQHNFLKEYSEEYLLKIDNGEQKQYELTIDALNKCKNNQTKKNLEKKKKSLEDKINYRNNGQKVTADNGSIGMSYICSLAKPEGKIIYLSGSGADETISDYGFNKVKHYSHSTIGGYFPKNLSTVFPWKNFFGNTQRAYLMKEETVTGTWGVEGRYPFLDKDVVQEFLWLSNDLKNKNYKSVIYNYLKLNNYPFEKNQKVGFNCGFMGDKDNFKKKDVNNLNIDKTPVGVPKGGRKDLIVPIEEFKNKIEDYKIFMSGTCRIRNLKLLSLTKFNNIDFLDINKIHSIVHLYDIIKYNKKNKLSSANTKLDLKIFYEKIKNIDLFIFEQSTYYLFIDDNNIYYTQDDIKKDNYYHITGKNIFIKKNHFINDINNLNKIIKYINKDNIKVELSDKYIQMYSNIEIKSTLSMFRFSLNYNLDFEKINEDKIYIIYYLHISSSNNELYLKYYNGSKYVYTNIKIENKIKEIVLQIECEDIKNYNKIGIGFYFKNNIENNFKINLFKFKCIIISNIISQQDDKIPDIIFKKKIDNNIIEDYLIKTYNLIKKPILLVSNYINNDTISAREEMKDLCINMENKYNYIYYLNLTIKNKEYLLDNNHYLNEGFKYIDNKLYEKIKNIDI